MNPWWHKSVVYQIYPKSFMDSNNDGCGDIQGIISKLDYLKFLGVDVLWLSPVYKSPMDDNGYDISDYEDIAPEFGTMKDIEELLLEAKKRDLKVMMDLVVNHTSDEHEWFKKSRESKDNEYRDFYVWRDPVDGKEPSNVNSFFSGSAWEYDEKTNQYYLHLFSKKQPDLNWDNEKVRKKIYDMMNFWIDKGVSGFRMDVIELIGKDIDKLQLACTENTHKYINEMNQKTFGKHDLITVGETGGVTTETAKLYSNPKRKELDMVFQFQHIALDEQKGKSKWDLKKLDLLELKEVLSVWQTNLGKDGWNSLYWNNHDQPRIVSRWGNDSREYREKSAKMLATLIHMMKGTPYIYQGEEIGMTNIAFDNINDYRDIETLNLYNERTARGYEEYDIMKSIKVKSRDNARTPMQWDESENAGFTKGNSWIKVNDNYKYINTKRALEDKNSIFYHYKKLIDLRKNKDIIIYGEYELILKENKEIFSYIRKLNDETLLVISNFYENITEFILPEDIKFDRYDLVISNYEDVPNDIRKFKLRPYESIVISLK